MLNPIPQAVCFPCCTPCPTTPSTGSGRPTKILNVNVNVNVNKQESDPGNNLSAPALNGADLEQKIRSAVNTALGEE